MLCSSIVLPSFFFPDFQASNFYYPVLGPGLSLLGCKIIFTNFKADSWLLSVSSSKNLRVVDLISIRIWLRIGWNFFHTHTPEGIKWIYLKDSYVLQGLGDLCYFSGSSLFLPFDATEHLFQDLPLRSSAVKSSAWHSEFTHTFLFFLFLFWWERLNYSFSPTSMCQKFPLERRGFYCSVKFIKSN